MKKTIFIDGKWMDAADGAQREVLNPANGELVGIVSEASPVDVSAAVGAAHVSFKKWAQLTPFERSGFLLRASEKLVERADEIAAILTMEQGKPLKEARGEVLFAADYFRWYSEESKRIYGETLPASSPNKRLMVIRQPIGVVAAITPWNFPILMPVRKIAPALAAGCPVILKPAEQTPLTALAMFECLEAAGFPAGVANLVTGEGAQLGPAFLENSKVRKITFTGSTAVGKSLMEGSAAQLKRVSLELGGHAPFIVFDDADLDQAAEACIVSKFRNAGQTCICSNRIYVQDTIMDAFAEKLAERARSLTIGNGLTDGVDIGPLIDTRALKKVETHLEDALSKGAQLVAGGSRWEGDGLKGTFYKPTVIRNVDETMLICREETFGPVAPLISFASEDDVIQQANDSDYGLASYVFTNDLSRAYRMSEALEYGMVGVNDPLPTVVQSPFIGWKESGIGYEGGKYAMDQFLELKYISMVLNGGA